MKYYENYPEANRGTIVVWGLLSAYPFGGMIWQVLHHMVGFRRLGFDVWYVEDSDREAKDPISWQVSTDYRGTSEFLESVLGCVGLAGRHIFRVPNSRNLCLGGSDFDGLMRLYKNSSAVFNLCGAQEYLPYHDDIKCKVYLETDPVVSQFAVASGNKKWLDVLSRYDYLFTYGENIGQDDCPVPQERFQWLPTRPPVISDWWEPMSTNKKRMTTIANWSTKGKDFEWKGVKYKWSKDFTRFIDLPTKTKTNLELAVVGMNDNEKLEMKKNGWHISFARELSDYFKYHDYICQSLAEFTVSKDQYVSTNSGWFSDRSVCYLAAGRPVITEETGFSKFIPVGEGLFSYHAEKEILTAIDIVCSDYERQSRKAKEIARDYFDADVVLKGVLVKTGLL